MLSKLLLLSLVMVFAAHVHQSRLMFFSPVFFLLTGVSLAFLGIFMVAVHTPNLKINHFAKDYLPGDLVILRLEKDLSRTSGSSKFEARIIAIENQRRAGKLFVTVSPERKNETDTIGKKLGYAKTRSLQIGDTLITMKTFNEIRSQNNPGSFDYQTYARSKNINHQLHLYPIDFVLMKGDEFGLLRWAEKINRILQKNLDQRIRSASAAAVSKAILLGSKDDINRELSNRYRDSGALHILAISGLHIGFILLLVMKIGTPLLYFKGGKIIRLILVLFVLWAYAVIAGLSASVVRAVSMFSLLSVAQVFGKQTNLFQKLVASFLILLLIRPLYLFDVGFQLSYAALFGIAATANFRKKFLKPRGKIKKYIYELLMISCAAQFAITPLSLFYFNQFSGLFLISSLSLIPLLGLTLISGFILLFLSIFEIDIRALSWFHESGITVINFLVEKISSFDFLIFKEIYFTWEFGILIYLVLFLLSTKMKTFQGLVLLSFALFTMQMIWLKDRISLLSTREIVVFNLWNESLIVNRRGNEILVFDRQDSLSHRKTKVLDAYRSNFPGSIFMAERTEQRKNKDKRLFYLDTALIFIPKHSFAIGDVGCKPQVLILRNSPKVNLERLMAIMRPDIVVADGSNYTSYVKRWKQTCTEQEVMFFETRSQGAFIYPIVN